MRFGNVEYTNEEIAVARKIAKTSKDEATGVYAKMLIAALYGKRVTLSWEEIYQVLVMDDAPGRALSEEIEYQLEHGEVSL